MSKNSDMMPQAPAHAFRSAGRLYSKSPPASRILQSLRPLICPFDDVLSHLRNSGTILDVGCGSGLFLGLAASRYPDITGVGFDTSDAAISAAKKMASSNLLADRLVFEKRSVSEPWPTGVFDVVSLIDVLHHIEVQEQREVIRKVVGKIGQDGLLIYKDMAPRPLLHAWWNRVHDLVMARQWINYRTSLEIREWLSEEGLKISHCVNRRIGPYSHDLIVATR